MAYGARQLNQQIVDNGSAATTGVKGSYSSIIPFRVRKFYIVFKSEPGATGAVTLKLRPTPGSATGETTIATLNWLVGANAGEVIYKAGLNQRVEAHEEVVVDVTDLDAGVTSFNAGMTSDPEDEEPANLGAAVSATT